MASIINAQRSTLIGTPQQIAQLLRVLRGSAGIINMAESNFLVLDKPLNNRAIETALRTTPDKGRKRRRR